MDHKSYFPLLLAAVVSLVACDSNLQDWSVQVEEGVIHTMACEPTNTEREPVVYENSTTKWFKHGRSGQIQNGTTITSDGKDGMFFITSAGELVLSPLNAFSSGIYFCKVYSPTAAGGDFEGTIVKGVNVNGPKKTGIDKYRTNVITGIITGVVVFALVCSGCFIDHFRYRSPEQKEKMQARKQERQARQDRLQSAGNDNLGMETGEEKMARNPTQEDTHL